MKQSFTKQRIARVVMTLLVMMLTSVEAWANVYNKPLQDPVRRNNKEYTEGMYWVSLPYSNDYDKYVTTLTEDDINNKCKGKIKVYDSKKYSQEYDYGCHGNLVIEVPEGYVLQLSGSISTGDENDYMNVYDGPGRTYDIIINKLWGKHSIPTVTTSGNAICISFNSDRSGQDGTGLNLTVTILKSIELVDKTDTESSTANSTAIDNNHGKLVGKVTLSGRTFTKNNDYYTLTLPFGMTAEQIATSPLAGATIKALKTTSNLTNGTLTLNFEDVSAIEAGTPYLVGWNTAESDPEFSDVIENPVFKSVTIDKELHPVEFTGGSFEGNYAPFPIDDTNVNEIAYIGSGNIIGYADPSSLPKALRPFRAHFKLSTSSGSRAVTRTIMNFGDGENGETTGIIMLPAEKSNAVGSEGWYTIDGRRLSGKPTVKGLYINNGHKVVIK